MVAIKIFLNCQNCSKDKIKDGKIIKGRKHQNYLTRRAKNTQQDVKLSLKKYCKFCRQTQVHQEQILSRSRGGKK